MTITVINSQVALPEILMPCTKTPCMGVLTWDGHHSWKCEGTSIWEHKCKFGLGFEAIVDAESMEAGLMGGTQYDKVTFTPYGIQLLWFKVIEVDWLTEAEIAVLYVGIGGRPDSILLHDEIGDYRGANRRSNSSKLQIRGPIE